MKQDQPHLVYGLLDLTQGGKLFYVGITKNLLVRLQAHLTGEPTNRAKVAVIERHAALGLLPGVVVLEEHAAQPMAQRAEAEMIALFRSLGHPLTNVLEGGEQEFERYTAGKRWSRRPKSKPAEPTPITTPPRKVRRTRPLGSRPVPLPLRTWQRCVTCQRWGFGCRRCEVAA
jgi:hypothetical protein